MQDEKSPRVQPVENVTDLESRTGVVIQLADGTIQSCDRVAEQLLGRSAQQLIGTAMFDSAWPVIHPDGSAFLPDDYPAIVALRSGDPCRDIVMGFSVPMDFPQSNFSQPNFPQPNSELDSERVWLCLSSTPLFQLDAATPHAVVTTLSQVPSSTSSLRLTEGETAEAKLPPDEQRFRQLADSLPHIVFAARPDGHVTYANRFAQEYTGLNDELLRQGWVRCIHPDDRDRVFQTWMRAAQTGEAYEVECRFHKADGTYRWLLNRGVPIRDAEGYIVEWVGGSTDIHEVKLAQAALGISEERLRLAVEGAGMATWDADLATGKTIWSVGHFQILGYEPTPNREATLEMWRSRIHPDDLESVMQAFETARQTRSLYCPEYRILRADNGEVFWLSVFGQFLYSEAGEAVRFIGVFFDSTERKRIEAELRESEARLRFMLDASQIGEWDLDLTTQPYTAHRSLRHDQIFGYATLLPEWSYEIFLTHVHPDDRAFVNERFQQTLSASIDWNFECRIIHADQSIHWIWSRSSVYCNQSGTPTRLLGMVVNITERKLAEQEREQLLSREQSAREAAEQASQIKDEFLAVLSHELRSPLNPILGWTKLLRSGKLNPARTAEALATIERNAQLQSQLIEDLLDLSRIMQGKLTLNPTAVSLARVVSAAIDTVRLAAEAKMIQVESNFETHVGQVYGDAGRLQQVVGNLLANAVKFTPAGGRVEVRLTQIGNTQIGNYIQLQVIDTGKGIKPEFIPYVFEHFRQEDGATTRRFGGLGLGLAIAHQIVEMHGGRIWVESPGEGQGATFAVELPRMGSGEDRESQEASLLVSPASPLPLAEIRALVVDDEPDSRELMAFVIEQAGADVIAVGSAIEALQWISTVSFDILLSDIGMPEMNGYTLMQEIRQSPEDRDRQIPAIALTAYAGEIDQQQALSAGFQIHMSKPVEPAEIIAIVARLCRRTGGEA